MKILHTADWHLGNTFHGHDRTAEHRHFLAWLLATLRERRPDALIVAGDVFDTTNPSARSESLLYDFLLEATEAVPGLQIVILAGNHDSAGRLEAPAALLKTHNVYVRGHIHYTAEAGVPDYDYHILPLATLAGGEAVCVCFALPFLRSSDYPAGMNGEQALSHYFTALHKQLRRSAFKGLPVVAASHFYATGAEICEYDHSERVVVGGQESVSVGVVGRDVSYTALGHIHKPQAVGKGSPAFYAGSPLPLSFGELNYDHGVQWVEIDEEGQAHVSRLSYSPLRRLLRLPEHGSATIHEILDLVARLPQRKGETCSDAAPYLELCVREQQPEPTLVNDLLRALADRDVHFCRVMRDLPDARRKAGEPETRPDVATLTPLALAEEVFSLRYGSPLPPALKERFMEAARRVAEDDTTHRA